MALTIRMLDTFSAMTLFLGMHVFVGGIIGTATCALAGIDSKLPWAILVLLAGAAILTVSKRLDSLAERGAQKIA